MFQTSLFDGEKPFKIDRPIRLIELFAGYGSQALALKYLGVPFEYWRICEWAVKSIQAYKDLHFGNDDFDYSKSKSENEIRAWLCGRISADYNIPLTEQQIFRLSEKQVRTIYNNMQATHNLGSITQINASDLSITDTDKYCYIMTYSFPCQDLSQAGKGKGMAKGSGTRSGLLWEVESILKGCIELPQVLLMENVPQVVGKKNMPYFADWISFLDSLGYKSKWSILNAKGFKIPQNRERCFMVSILGDYYFNFPRERELEYRLKDFLDKNVGESYYLSQKTVESLNLHKARHQAKGNGFGWQPTNGGGTHTQSRLKVDTAQTVTLLLSNQGKTVEKITDVASTLEARDYKGFGNQAMNAVMEIRGGADGILLGKSPSFQRPPLTDLSRTIDTQGSNGVVEWKSSTK